MPSIMHTEDEERKEEPPRQTSESGSPEPPLRYDANNVHQPEPQKQLIPGPIDYEFQKARRLILAAQIMSIVSLVIGGVLLSCAAVVVAVIGSNRVKAHMNGASESEAMSWYGMKRWANMAIIMSVLALVINAVALWMFYPMMIEMLQSGDLGSMMGTSTQGSTAGSGSSIWG